MASFNPATSVSPRQAGVLSATLPPPAPAPFFGGNTANASPSAPVVPPPVTPPPADTFTATAPAPVATTAPTETPQDNTVLAPNTPTTPDAADAQKAEETSKKENGFVKFAKSPPGIGAGVLAAAVIGLAVWKPWQGGKTSIDKLEKIVKDLNQDGLEPQSISSLLQQYTGHLHTLTSDTGKHTPDTWGKISAAIEAVHAKHGTHEIAQLRLLQGLDGTQPSDLTSLSGSAQQAIQETSESFMEGLGKKTLKPGEGADYAPYLKKAADWLLRPGGGITDEASLLKTSKTMLDALAKVDPEQKHLPELHKLNAFTLSNKDFPMAKKGDTLPEVDLTQITDVISAGTQLHNARLNGKDSTKEVLDHLKEKGIGEGYGELSKEGGFEKLGEMILPNKKNPILRVWDYLNKPLATYPDGNWSFFKKLANRFSKKKDTP